jgi:hypothetical protein
MACNRWFLKKIKNISGHAPPSVNLKNSTFILPEDDMLKPMDQLDLAIGVMFFNSFPFCGGIQRKQVEPECFGDHQATGAKIPLYQNKVGRSGLIGQPFS